MPRLVRHDAMKPIKIEPQDKPIFVCACGLSKKFPLCDGSHKGCINEPEDKVVVYDSDKSTIIEERDAN